MCAQESIHDSDGSDELQNTVVARSESCLEDVFDDGGCGTVVVAVLVHQIITRVLVANCVPFLKYFVPFSKVCCDEYSITKSMFWDFKKYIHAGTVCVVNIHFSREVLRKVFPFLL